MKMNEQTKFDESVALLKGAFDNGQLIHGDIGRCATAVLLAPTAARLGVDNAIWSILFVTTMKNDGTTKRLVANEGEILAMHTQVQRINAGAFVIEQATHEVGSVNPKELIPDEVEEGKRLLADANRLINESPYSREELEEVENAFETVKRVHPKEEWERQGAYATLDVLAKTCKVDGAAVITARALFGKN